MIKTTTRIGLMLSLLVSLAATTVHAGQASNKTQLTFSQPVEVAGHVLPAGTYTFVLADTLADRHIVQIFDANGSQLIASVMAVPTSRPAATDETVSKFVEVPAASPEAVRAWFNASSTTGYEFVYPKPRAAQLAKAVNAPVPAVAADVTEIDALKTAAIVAITPDDKEIPVSATIHTTPVEPVAPAATPVEPAATPAATPAAPVATPAAPAATPATATPLSSVSSSTASTPVTEPVAKPAAPVANAPATEPVAKTDATVAGQPAPAPVATTGRQLPKTSSVLPFIALLGLVAIGTAICLMAFGRRRKATAVIL